METIVNSSKPEKMVFTVSDVENILDIGKNQAYELVNSGAFPVKRIGKKIVISKQVFYNWLNCPDDQKVS